MTQLAALAIPRTRRSAATAILGIGTAAPPSATQQQTLQLARQIACLAADQHAWMQRVYLRAGIEKRGVAVAADDRSALQSLLEFYPAPASADDRGPTTAARMARYAQAAPPLAHAAATRALADAKSPAKSITHLFTVSCTGFFAPGLDSALINSLGLSRSVRRLHVGFMGCHATFNALAAARAAVRADPAARALVCSVELCSLHFAYGADPGKQIANALFADGAAAVVLGRARAGNAGVWTLRDTSSFLLPESADAMTWTIGDHGFEMTLSPGVPGHIRRHLRSWCQGWLARHDLAISDIRGWAIHPGGPRILDAAAESLGLDQEAMRFSRRVLADHGNMSSATVTFILQEMAGKVSGPCVAVGLGPGLMAEGMLLTHAMG
jgi:predicted naringenin-chalcone synthase